MTGEEEATTPTETRVEPSAAVHPDDYAAFAEPAKALGDISSAYFDALAAKERQELQEDRYYLERAKDYVELHDQIDTSKTTLDSLESFLSTFQHDLSSVSGQIADLQGRSRLIEGRLQGRRAVESLLGPLVSSIALPPEIITMVLDTEPSDAWLPMITDLEARLIAIRSGPRLETRKSLDEAAERIRIKAADRLRSHLIGLLTPYRTSVSSSLQALQAEILLKYRPFFAFLQRLAPRQAHEVQKAYISTAAWYYETGFRRYTRALERIRLRSVPKDPSAPPDAALSSPLAAMASATLDGASAVPGVKADERELRMSPDALFRSISLVVQDNATTEHAFLSAFFGQPGPSRSRLPTTTPNGSASEASWDVLSSAGTEEDGDTSSMIGSDATASASASAERIKRSLVDNVWRQVFEGGLEYAKNFVHALLDPPPPPVSVLAMIRLNDAIHHSKSCPAAAFDSYLVGTRLSLWPLFQRGMDAQAESLRKIASTSGTSVFKSGGSVAKEQAVSSALRHYAALFTAVVALSEDADDEMVFNSVLRLRGELQKLLDTQASRLTDTKRQSAYLSTHYEDLLKLVRAGPTSHPRCQAEIAHWREKARRSS